MVTPKSVCRKDQLLYQTLSYDPISRYGDLVKRTNEIASRIHDFLPRKTTEFDSGLQFDRGLKRKQLNTVTRIQSPLTTCRKSKVRGARQLAPASVTPLYFVAVPVTHQGS